MDIQYIMYIQYTRRKEFTYKHKEIQKEQRVIVNMPSTSKDKDKIK